MTNTLTHDLAQLPLGQLKALAQSASDSATRAAAKREMEGRIGGPKSAELRVTVACDISEYDVPLPTLRLHMRDSAGATRELRALTYEAAAKAERALMRQPDGWGVLVDIAVDGRVMLDLMDGSEAEQTRALALLRTIAPEPGRKKRGRKPGQKASAPSNGKGPPRPAA